MCPNRSFALNEKAGSVSKHPPPAFGGSSIPYSFASCSCTILLLPLIIPRSSRLIKPFFSGSVFPNSPADNGLTIFPSRSDSFSMVFKAGPC